MSIIFISYIEMRLFITAAFISCLHGPPRDLISYA